MPFVREENESDHWSVGPEAHLGRAKAAPACQETRGKPWRRGGDSNPRTPYEVTTLAMSRIQPLCHLSK